MKKRALWDPPFIVDDSRPKVPADYRQQLTSLLAQNRRGDMVELFMTAAVGMPKEFVAPMRQAPFWAAQEAVAHTRSEEHTSELQSQSNLVCRLLLGQKKKLERHARRRQRCKESDRLLHIDRSIASPASALLHSFRRDQLVSHHYG